MLFCVLAGASELPDAVRADLLTAHQAGRAAVAATPPLPPLQWSRELAAFAQDWAEQLAQRQCALQHRGENGDSAQRQLTVAGGPPQLSGENLYMAWSSESYADYLMPAADVVASWLREGADYDYAGNRCRPGQVCGHYTQAVWRDSRWLGCGRARCTQQEVWVCNYSPAGNVQGQRPY